MGAITLVRLFAEVFSVSLRRTLAYRADLLFQLGMALVGTFAGVATLAVVFSRTASLAGWSPAAAMVLLGTFEGVSGVLNTFVQPNLSFFEGKVRDGEIDDVLLQPVPSILQASLGTCYPLALSQVFLGLAVVMLGAGRLDPAPPPGRVIGYGALVLAAVVIGWASRVFVASLAFWAPHVSLSMFYTTFWQLGRYPVEVYRPPLGFVLTYFLPVAFVATIPARFLADDAPPILLLGVALVATGSVLLARVTWNAGLRRYTGATS